jgi:hypothetical protein
LDLVDELRASREEELEPTGIAALINSLGESAQMAQKIVERTITAIGDLSLVQAI